MRNLRKLLSPLKVFKIEGDLDFDIAGLTSDSRLVEPGFIFVCIKGFKTNGHRYIQQALERGAKAIVGEEEIELDSEDITKVRVEDSRRALALLSNEFYDHPSEELKLIGVTGTNGKTTTTYITRAILEQAGFKTALTGTIGYYVGDEHREAYLTTPESLELQGMMRKAVEGGCDYFVVEVSSHSLELKRVVGCEFETAVFTNLTLEHLELHGTMERYLEAKATLFRQLGQGSRDKSSKRAVINSDDPHSNYLLSQTRVPIITYGLEKQVDIKGEIIRRELRGTAFKVDTPYGDIELKLGMPDDFNVYNCLAAIGVALSQNIDLDTIKEGINNFSSVPGRFEFIDYGQDFDVIVDYAHNPDGLEKVLSLISRFAPRRIITVFGCAGERDRSKRPVMGEIVARYSDLSFITTDNPRGEDPLQTAEDALVGFKSDKDRAKIVLDRREAIERALSSARQGDVVLIAGKGHERVQVCEDGYIPFNDGEVVRKFLSRT